MPRRQAEPEARRAARQLADADSQARHQENDSVAGRAARQLANAESHVRHRQAETEAERIARQSAAAEREFATQTLVNTAACDTVKKRYVGCLWERLVGNVQGSIVTAAVNLWAEYNPGRSCPRRTLAEAAHGP